MNLNGLARRMTGLLPFTNPRQLNTLLEWIYPPQCTHCGRVDTYFCDQCTCELTAVPLLIETSHSDSITKLVSMGPHEGLVQSAIHALKYHNRPDLAIPLGQRLNAWLETQQLRFDMLISVPIHPTRLAKRGYNQSYKLAEVIADHHQIPLQLDALTRKEETRSQVGLSRAERQKNVADAFEVNEALVAGKILLLIDDVQTTGATLEACARTARAANAHDVYALTISRAKLDTVSTF